VSTTRYKLFAGILGLLCVALFVFLVRQGLLLSEIRRVTQHANDRMWLIRSDRQWAIEKTDVTNAVTILSKLQMPVMLWEYGDNRVLAHAVELERQKAIREIIDSLKARTGQDLGREPKPWIMAFGDRSTTNNQESLEEWFEEMRKENEARWKQVQSR
jgi:hypothetical protein